MKYEIEIPDGMIPEGYEPVEYRIPLDGDIVLGYTGEPSTWKINYNMRQVIILRKKWTWPSWLNADRIEWDKDGWTIWISYRGFGFRNEAQWKECFNCEPPPDKTKVYNNPNKVKPCGRVFL